MAYSKEYSRMVVVFYLIWPRAGYWRKFSVNQESYERNDPLMAKGVLGCLNWVLEYTENLHT